jgi:hypothetical protein
VKKVIPLLAALALLLAPLTAARADFSDRLKEAAQGLGEALDWVGRAMTVYDIAKKAFGKDEVQVLDRKLREVQIAVAEIPSIRSEIGDIRTRLQDRPTRQEVLKLLADLRADMEVELRKLEARVGKLERRTDKLERRADEHDARLREHDAQLREKGAQIEELQMREALRSPSAYERPSAVNTKRGRLLLATGGEVFDAVLTGVDAKGVRCVIDGKEKHYPPGEVLSISTQAGFFHYDPESGDFRFRPHSSDPTAAGQRPRLELKTIARDSLNKIDGETLVILKAMKPGELDDLRGFAVRRGYDWDKLELEKQLPLVRQKLLQDHRTEVLKMISDYNCTELQALRRVIHRLAEEAQR